MSENEQENAGTDQTDVSESTDSGELGDKGKKAIDEMKAKWKEQRDARKALDAEVSQLKTQLAELSKAKSESSDKDEKADLEAVRKEIRDELSTVHLRERALDKLEAKAAKSFADPEDARALLTSQVDSFIDNGKLDTEAIDEALSDLLTRKPHLAADTRRFKEGVNGGPRNGQKPNQLTQADLRNMSADEILKAKADGRLSALMGGKKS